jgi:hypothetical protein
MQPTPLTRQIFSNIRRIRGVTDRFSKGLKNPGRPPQLDLMVEFGKTKAASYLVQKLRIEFTISASTSCEVCESYRLFRIQLRYPLSLDGERYFETET